MGGSHTTRYGGWQPPEEWRLNTTEEGWYIGDEGEIAEE
jgi:hypothetical protein